MNNQIPENISDNLQRKKSRKLCRLFVQSMDLMKKISLEELNDHTLVLLFNSSANYPGFVNVFNGKVYEILRQRKLLKFEKEIV